MNNQPLEETLVAELQRGSQNALNALVHRYYASITVFANRKIDNPQDAQQIANNAFYELWKKHANFKNIAGIKNFLYTTARNACFNYLKHQKVEKKRSKNLPPPPQDDFDFDAEVARCETLPQVYQCINELPRQCQKVVRMSIFDGLKNPEIAQQLSLSEQTVKNHKQRAIQLLKMRLSGGGPLLLTCMLLVL